MKNTQDSTKNTLDETKMTLDKGENRKQKNEEHILVGALFLPYSIYKLVFMG